MTVKLSGPIVPPRSGAAPTHAVVLLHGYGSDGSDLIGLAPAWQDALPDALFLAPNAPEPSRMVSFGFQWFDIALEGNRLSRRQAGAAAARPVLVSFLEDLWEQTGIAPGRTILAGFSQGAMMALHVGLSLQQRLMGIVAVAGAFLPPADFDTAGYATPPICLVHGDRDDVVEPIHSQEAAELLSKAGYEVSYHVSRGVGHGISPDGLQFATDFIGRLAAE
jgi:phospholipase/carboxylesterase